MTGAEVLVVGAGPTGLTLAALLHAQGVAVRLVDAQRDQVHETRALAVQPRTLEVLAPLGVSEQLVAAGRTAVDLVLHSGERATRIELFGLGASDTAYPFLLFVSQAETERVLNDHLAGAGLTVERGVRLTGLGVAGDEPLATLRHPDGRVETAQPRFVVGCDGGHSAVRELSGIAFTGSAYPQTFALADLDVDGLDADPPAAGGPPAHAFLGSDGILLFFPLRSPAPWRLITMRSAGGPAPPPVTLDELQRLADRQAPGLKLRDPVWLSDFRLHLRRAERYRQGPVLVAGDAAHVHSPAGAQGMNTGIQDSVNLAWKLALVVQGRAGTALLDSYEAERMPVGRTVLRFTDRAFRAATSQGTVVRTVRGRVLPRLAPLLLRTPARAAGFRAVSELGISYRGSPAVTDDAPRPRRGLHAGDRLPDGSAVVDGAPARLHGLVRLDRFALLLCGPDGGWPDSAVARLVSTYADVLACHWVDSGIGGGGPTIVLVRPDGHIGYYGRGADLGGAWSYLQRWLPRPVA